MRHNKNYATAVKKLESKNFQFKPAAAQFHYLVQSKVPTLEQ